MIKRTDCHDFIACEKMFKAKGTDFTCEGCPGPAATRRVDPKDLKPWELKELERKAKTEKKKAELSLKPPRRITQGNQNEKPEKKTKSEKKEMSLLEKAKSKKCVQRRTFNSEEFDLAIHWLDGKLTNHQVNFAYGVHGSTAIYRIAICLREMYRQGKIVIK